MIAALVFSMFCYISISILDFPSWLKVIYTIVGLAGYLIAYAAWERHKDRVEKLEEKINQLNYKLEEKEDDTL